MPKHSNRNEPLGLRHAPARRSASSLPSPYPPSSGRETRSQNPSGRASAQPSEKDHQSFPFHSSRSHSHRTPSPTPEEKKRTTDGTIILDPQPDDSGNDPLNWAAWRRDIALLSLGFYCALGGGMTPVLAAGFTDVADTYGVSIPQVALTTGFYMLGLGLGSVVASPTAILFGKRPVYLAGATLFIATSVWCAASPSYASLVVARVLMGVSVSPVECLPSATIAEIFFLHERAYRLGIYTLLLLGGKNLIPLVSAAIIGSLGWRWVFWIIAITVAFSLGLLFFFVPETFWDRTPQPSKHHHNHHQHGHHHHLASGVRSAISHLLTPNSHRHHVDAIEEQIAKDPRAAEAMHGPAKVQFPSDGPHQGTIAQRRQQRTASHHVGFAGVPSLAVHDTEASAASSEGADTENDEAAPTAATAESFGGVYGARTPAQAEHLRPQAARMDTQASHRDAWKVEPRGDGPPTPAMHGFNSPSYAPPEQTPADTKKDGSIHGATTSAHVENLRSEAANTTSAESHQDAGRVQSKGEGSSMPALEELKTPGTAPPVSAQTEPSTGTTGPSTATEGAASATSSRAPLNPLHSSTATSTTADLAKSETPPDLENPRTDTDAHSVASHAHSIASTLNYTRRLKRSGPRTFVETLRLWNGRLRPDGWFRVAVRPFILFAYPAILWSTLVYSLSIGWLIVLSESVANIYRAHDTYNFNALQAGLVYISPFIGGVLGTAVAGKASDFVVRAMARRNDGVYEPEFRLLMAAPVLVTTAVGLMGFGWSAEERDAWSVPTVFFGIISFGCSLGSTTAISFAVDSYRQYAGEALVTLNFSKSAFTALSVLPKLSAD